MFIPICKQNISEQDKAAVQEALSDDMITRGKRVEQFETDFSTYCGSDFAVSFNSGTSALQAAYFAANVMQDDLVVTTPNTFVGTFVGALNHGAQVRFTDIDPTTGNMDLSNEELTNAKVITPVHFSGIPVDVKSLRTNALIIEDAAHALGALDREGNKVGACVYSDMTVFSFHPAKSITTGEGGMVTTNDPDLYEKLKLFRNNGMVRCNSSYPGYYEVEAVTGNYHLTEFQAALGSSQLRRVDDFVQKRRALVKVYREAFADLTLLSDEFDSLSSHHLFIALIDYKSTRKAVMEALRERGVGTQVHYMPAYHHPIFSGQPTQPKMETYFQQALTLPLYYDMSEETAQYVATQLLEVL